MSLAFSFSLTTFKEINVFLVGIVSYPSVKNKRKLAITGQIPTTKKRLNLHCWQIKPPKVVQ